MPLTSIRFERQPAPCGQVVDGQSYHDRDEQTVLTQELDFACGCRSVRHDYHDGSVSRRIVRHDGTVLVDELLSAE